MFAKARCTILEYILLSIALFVAIGVLNLVPRFQEPGPELLLSLQSKVGEGKGRWESKGDGKTVIYSAASVRVVNHKKNNPISVRQVVALPQSERTFLVRAEIRADERYEKGSGTRLSRVVFVGLDGISRRYLWNHEHHLKRGEFAPHWKAFEKAFKLPKEVTQAALILQSGDGVGWLEMSNPSVRAVEATYYYISAGVFFFLCSVAAFVRVANHLIRQLVGKRRVVALGVSIAFLIVAVFPGDITLPWAPAMSFCLSQVPGFVHDWGPFFSIRFDHILHFVVFALLAILFVLQSKVGNLLEIALPLILMSVLVECLQYFSSGREISLIDAVAGVFGVALICGLKGLYDIMRSSRP